MNSALSADESPDTSPQTALSYKFQRLREKLREAIANGQLEGKLPGERALAKRFHVNAKTLSKALTDLAAEGLLDRSIGRGTFVKGSAPAVATARHWLLVCDPEQSNCDLVRILGQAHPDLDVLSNVGSVRPSRLNQFGAVIVMSPNVPDSFIRDLVVRNISVVMVDVEPRIYSTHAVLCDRHLAVSMAGRDLLLGGHRRIAAVEPAQCTLVADTLRKTAVRYSPDATVEACFPQDVTDLVGSGITAFVCYSAEIASEVKAELENRNLAIPSQVSVVSVGTASNDQPVSGYYVPPAEKVKAVAQLLQHPGTRPSTIWLTGRFVDRGTIAPVNFIGEEQTPDFHRAAI
jgi:hypothetical protein